MINNTISFSSLGTFYMLVHLTKQRMKNSDVHPWQLLRFGYKVILTSKLRILWRRWHQKRYQTNPPREQLTRNWYPNPPHLLKSLNLQNHQRRSLQFSKSLPSSNGRLHRLFSQLSVRNITLSWTNKIQRLKLKTDPRSFNRHNQRNQHFKGYNMTMIFLIYDFFK